MSLGIFLKITPWARRSPAAATSPRPKTLRPPDACDRALLLADQSQHACRDARGMPIHSHHGVKELEPERMRKPPQIFVPTPFVHRHLPRRTKKERASCRRFLRCGAG